MPLTPELISHTSQNAGRSLKSVTFGLVDYEWVFHPMPGELRIQLEWAAEELNARREGYVVAKAQWLKSALEQVQGQFNDLRARWGHVCEAYTSAEEMEEALWHCYVDSTDRFRVRGSGELTVSQNSTLDKLYENWQESKKTYDFWTIELEVRHAELMDAKALCASLYQEADAKFDAEITDCLLKAMHIASQLNAAERDFEHETTDSLACWEHAAASVFPAEVLCSNASSEELPASAGSAVTASGCELGELLRGEWPDVGTSHGFQ